MALTVDRPHDFLEAHAGVWCRDCGNLRSHPIHQPLARVAAALIAAGHAPELAPALCQIAARALIPDRALMNWLSWHRGDCTAAEFQRFADRYRHSSHELAGYRSKPGGAA